ncbi:zona pellucida sperm-binding protein 3-like [Megalops cyprinoides]|uniref:zona pellucida sperm-binding protein 3-like n=1 Tax=Megalops cyprinoides TaxID=118141 RepID=UPI001864680E|nr:zona pellucida sperm-binding protein 3-like [Megalops cyprinoides]
MDLFGIGQLIDPADLTLGGCGSTGLDSTASVVVFETELQGCGSTLMMTEDSLIYGFDLNYQPKALGDTPIVRTNEAVVGIQCHYMRLHNVSSNALQPTWIPYRSTMSAEDVLVFSLRLMTDDWQAERTSNVFFLGDTMNIEASVVQANHVPLRVFADSCVATLVPDLNAVPRYAFIENHGCLMDAKLTDSRSKFLPRVQDDKLKIQLDSFRFFQDSRSSVYIICHLKATAASATTDSQYKACSFSTAANRWMAAGGNDQVCGCCDASCGFRKGRSVEAALQGEGDATLGPIIVQSAQEAEPEFQMLPVVTKDHKAAAASPEVVVLAAVVAIAGLVCVTVLLTVLLRKRHKLSV